MNTQTLENIKRFFAKWWSSLDFNSKTALVTFSALVLPIFILGKLHVDGRVGLGTVFGTLLAVGFFLFQKNVINKISRTNRPKLQGSLSNQ